ncbi:MAG TPA: indole-3-glycerol phosphate synthase TrpC [Planctomycetota bacterium]|nr:indole-3-glycerol phosphate synthase TrpC [Planctomycetota bacterium]
MILDEIVTAKKAELKRSKHERRIEDLKAKARNARPVPAFDLRQPGAVSIIAEVKRASPVKGVFKPDLDAGKQALAYAEGGARAISVLTDHAFFQGSVDDLRAARDASGLPILRKDFIIDEYQLWEAKVMRASAALLIVAILDRPQLRDYIAFAREELKLATLVEVHTERELDRALDAGATLLGINNRDLNTFQVTLETTARLRAVVPPGVVTVSESGISKREDLLLLRQMKVDAALIGEELVRAPDPAAKIRELLGASHAR